jgi:hypothetical protein
VHVCVTMHDPPLDLANVDGPSDLRNLRTCGRIVGDKQAPPRIFAEGAKRSASQPTIPSRFETTIHKGRREVLGFGSHTLRWSKDGAKAAMPGPGQYGQPKSFTQEFLERESTGIRGTGGFASRSERVGPRSVPALPRAGRGVPGPGKYNDGAALTAIRNGKDFNQASATSAFAPPVQRTLSNLAPVVDKPGPGHYNQNLPDAREPTAAVAAFKSQSSQRGDARIPGADVPGPGAYHDGVESKSNFEGQAVKAARAQEAYSAVFKTPSRPRIISVNRDLPTCDKAGREVLREFADQVGRECHAGFGARRPGPGEYEVNRDAMWEGALVSAVGSSAFQAGPKRSDFVSGESRLLPGPGRYNPNPGYVVPDRLTDAKSAFVTKVDRGRVVESAAPGPCYYTPSLPKATKSFRLRVQNPDDQPLWVPSVNTG